LIIAIGYQVNSVLGTKFRIWATKSFDNFKIEQIVRNYLNISSLRVIFGVAQPELSQPRTNAPDEDHPWLAQRRF
jgi:hypothetical protein